VPRGAAVIRYDGKRAVVWRIQYRDASGRYLKDTLGPEPTWTRQKAERELGKRLAAAEDGYRKPPKLTLTQYTDRFLNDYLPGRNLKPTTLENYHYILNRHLLPALGQKQLSDLEAEPHLIDVYIAHKTRQGLSAKTIHNHLLLLNQMLKRAVIWRLIRTNPTDGIDRPRLNQPEMNILTEPEIARLLAAYDQMADAADDHERDWWQLAKSIVITALGTGMRRGELLGLRWGAVNLLDGVIQVREAHVRGQTTTPKSRASRRTLELGPRTQATLEERWQAARWRCDENYVFSHPQLGTPLDPSKLARHYFKRALEVAGITKPFRPFHDLRHTSLTHAAAAGNPTIYVQARAGHAQASITERYLHASQTQFPDAARRSEQRLFGDTPRAGRGAAVTGSETSDRLLIRPARNAFRRID